MNQSLASISVLYQRRTDDGREARYAVALECKRRGHYFQSLCVRTLWGSSNLLRRKNCIFCSCSWPHRPIRTHIDSSHKSSIWSFLVTSTIVSITMSDQSWIHTTLCNQKPVQSLLWENPNQLIVERYSTFNTEAGPCRWMRRRLWWNVQPVL